MSFKYDVWNAWTSRSKNIPFESSEHAIGDGEKKLGCEYDVEPQGQNCPYDLEINGEKWEIKKLDDDNSFRLGIEVATQYTPIISKVVRILENIIDIEEKLLECKSSNLIQNCINKIKSKSGSSKTLLLDGLRKNEVSESNLSKACDILEEIKELILTDGQIKLYSSNDGKHKVYGILQAYKKLKLESITIDEMVMIIGDREIYNRLLLTDVVIDDLKTFQNITLREILNKTIRGVFENVTLVLVHEQFGYMPIADLHKIYCNRITSGLPRCKLL